MYIVSNLKTPKSCMKIGDIEENYNNYAKVVQKTGKITAILKK